MRLLDFFFAARPLLHLPIWTVYLISLHYHHRLSGENLGWTDLAVMAGMSLLCAGAAYLNQVYDFESDRINRKVGFLQRGFLDRTRLSAGFVVASLIPLAMAPLISRFLLFVFAQLLVLSYVYSAPPFRLKDRPVGGLFANVWAHGLLVPVAVMPDMTIHNAGLLDWSIPIYFFFAVGATHVLTTLPDRVGDVAVGKRTLAVVLGRRGALAAALVLLVLAAFTAFTSQHALLFYLAVGAGFAVVAALFLGGGASARFAAKAPLMVLTLAAGYWYPLYLVFVVALLIATRAYYHKRFGVVYPELA